MAPVAVCFDVEVASALVGHGSDTVLCTADAGHLTHAVWALRTTADGRGRLAVLAGNPADAAVEAAALAMAGELFGGQPVLVRAVDQAGWQMTRAIPPGASGSSTVDSQSFP